MLKCNWELLTKQISAYHSESSLPVSETPKVSPHKISLDGGQLDFSNNP